MSRTLSDLLSALPFEFSAPDTNPEITAPVTENAREVATGGVFVARVGRSADGHNYISQAINNGAVAIVGEKPIEEVREMLNGVPYAQVVDGYQALGYLAAAYEGFPSRRLIIIAVTGTDGKTTTSTIAYHVLKAAGVRVGLVTTVSAVIGDNELSTGLHVTTPPAHEVQRYLRHMVEAGMTHCVLETTSFGIDQGRINGVEIDVAVMTNVTHEHLDWHGSWEAYRDAKRKLFTLMKDSHRKSEQPKIAVINADDPSAPDFAESSVGADYMMLYSLNDKEADFYADRIHYTPAYTSFMLRGNAGDIPIRLPMLGAYNVSNALAGIIAAISAMPQLKNQQRMINAIPQGIANLPIIPGRMERIDEGQKFTAIVDFAHTPNALHRAIETGRLILPKGGRVIVVFGSAGLRDQEKRRLMAEIGAEYADISILTAEDPRNESLLGILDEMAQGARSKGAVDGESLFIEPDRGRAIFMARQMARPEDVVLACGKGHEQSMCFGKIEHTWDDREAMRSALRGKPVLTLPSATEPYDTRELWLSD